MVASRGGGDGGRQPRERDFAPSLRIVAAARRLRGAAPYWPTLPPHLLASRLPQMDRPSRLRRSWFSSVSLSAAS